MNPDRKLVKRGPRLPTREITQDQWRDRAACRNTKTDLFYPRKDEHPKLIELAKSTCRRCPVQDQCLTEAIKHGEPDGIWGGLDPKEREKMRRTLRLPKGKPPTVPFPHGTDAGHKRHEREGTPACAACNRAHQRAKVERQRRKNP